MSNLQFHPFHLGTQNCKTLSLRLFITRQEYHTRSVTSAFRQRNALKQNKFVRYLHGYAGSVAGFVIGAFGTSVLHILEHLQPLFDHIVTFHSVDIDYHADSAGIVFICGIVKSVLSGQFVFIVSHAFFVYAATKAADKAAMAADYVKKS